MLYNYIPRVIQLGPLKLQVFGMFVALAILIAAKVSMKLAEERGIRKELILDFLIIGVVVGIIGARVLHVLVNLQDYTANPLSIFSIHEGGLAIYGSIMGGGLVALWFSKKHGIKFWNFADIVAPGLAIGEAVGRIGCDVYGQATTNGFFPLYINGVQHHNVPLYTFLLMMASFFIVWRLRDRLYNGQLFLLYLLLQSGSRYFIEFFRISPSVGSITIFQLGNILFIATALGLWTIKYLYRERV